MVAETLVEFSSRSSLFIAYINMTKPVLKKLIPFFILAVGVAIFVLLKITQPPAIPVTHSERSWRVQTLIAKPQQLAPSLTLYGQIETPELVQASAPMKSRVTSIYVREGDPIKKGKILLTLDERDFKPHLIQAEAGVAELKGQIQSEQSRYKADKEAYSYEKSILQLEQSAVKRAKMLKDKNLGSVATLEEAEAKLKRQQLAYTDRKLALDDHASRLQQLNARLTNAKAEVELAQLDLERSQVIAPFDGFVEKLSVSTGNQVQDNQLLLTFYSTEQLEVRAKIPVTFQNEIQKALLANQALSASAHYAGAPLHLELNRLSGMADARGIDALFSFLSGSEWVRPGSSISLSLTRATRENVIVLPYSAIYDNNRIYRVIDDHLQLVNVQIIGNYLAENNEKLLIFSDEIQPSDKILITHLPNAMSGLKVDIGDKLL